MNRRENMRVKIAEAVHMTAPLEVGKDLGPGDVVEVDGPTAANWIARGWAAVEAQTEVKGEEG
jgi:hypothetical protein